MSARVLVTAGPVLVAALVAGAPAWRVWLRRRRPGRRLAGLIPALPRGDSGSAAGRPTWFRSPGWLDRVRLASALGGTAVAVLAGGWWGAAFGVATAVALDRVLRRLEPAAERARRLREAADLPLAADLLAVVLRGGTPVDRAVEEVARALPGPLGDRLARVARLQRLGATPGEAWEQLAPVTGADRLVRAAVRSADHGASLADALSRLAEDLRADRTIAVESAARRAGVLIVLPLGLCFLPAFILAGLVPVIVAVLGDVL